MDEKGQLAGNFIRALLVVLIVLVLWYLGNIILYGEVGIVTITDVMGENLQTTSYFGGVRVAVGWLWSLFPYIFLIGAAFYVIFSTVYKRTG